MIRTILANLRSQDVRVWADGDRLRCEGPPDVLTSQLRDQLRQHKHAILEFLRSAETLAGLPSAVVPLQPRGTRPPIFAVPGHNGDVFCYRALAQHLGEDQPLYGLRPPGLDGEGEPLARVEDLAAYFARQVLAVRPAGPCIIAGFCAGGMTAFELGRQLQQADTPIGFIALFGAPYPTSYRWLPQLRQRLEAEAERLTTHARALASLPSARWRSYIAQGLRARKARLAAEKPAAPDPVLVLRTRVERATIAAGSRYLPGDFGGRVCLFLPCEDWPRVGNEALRWRSVAEHTEEFFGPRGCNGDNMLREPYAPAFAELFRKAQAKRIKHLEAESPKP